MKTQQQSGSSSSINARSGSASLGLVSGSITLLAAVIYCGYVIYAPPLPAARERNLPTKQPTSNKPSQNNRLPFVIKPSSIPANEIRSGGVQVDGIPTITDPPMLSQNQFAMMRPQERIIGVVIKGKARAYPIKVLMTHECINDTLNDQPIAVTYCPLCDSAVVFSRTISSQTVGEQETVEFGVSGSLYNSNVLFYNRNAKGKSSLWSQMQGEAVTGPNLGKRLKALPLELTTWKNWFSRHPKTEVIAGKKEKLSDYDKPVYERYFKNDRLMFPVKPVNARMPNKTPLLGIRVGKKSRAYRIDQFALFQTKQTLKQTLAGKSFTLEYDPESKSLRTIQADAEVESIYAFWFAWSAFHPQTELYSPKK